MKREVGGEKRERYARAAVPAVLALVVLFGACGGTGDLPGAELRWSDRDPAWSPDGRWVAFASSRTDRDGNFDLYAVRADGTDTRRLTRLRVGGHLTESEFVEQLVVADPRWSADGLWLVFRLHGYPCIGYGCTYQDGGLYAVRSDGSHLRRLMAAEPVELEWSPQGADLVANDGEHLLVVRPDGSRRVLAPVGDAHTTWISPSELAVTRRRSVEILELHRTKVEQNTFMVRGEGPALSPDAKRVAYRGADGALYVADLDGSNRRKLIGGVALDYAWASNGRRLAFVKCRDAPGNSIFYCEIYSIDPDGTDLQRLTEGGLAEGVRWSANGSFILFNSEGGDAFVPASGGAVREIPGDAQDPAWSRDGLKIVFSGPDSPSHALEDDRAALYVMNASTGRVELLTQRRP